MTNRKGRNREASEQKGREKATQIGEKGVIIKGDTKKIFFGIPLDNRARSLHLLSRF